MAPSRPHKPQHAARHAPRHSDLELDSDAPVTSQAIPASSRTNEELNLKVLQRYDPSVVAILSIAPYVVLYKFSPVSGEWEKSGMEGTMFVHQLEANAEEGEERFGVFLLNRRGLENFHYQLKTAAEVENANDFIIISSKHSDGHGGCSIYGIWIYADGESSEVRTINTRVIQALAERAEASIATAGSDGLKAANLALAERAASMLSLANAAEVKAMNLAVAERATALFSDINSGDVVAANRALAERAAAAFAPTDSDFSRDQYDRHNYSQPLQFTTYGQRGDVMPGTVANISSDPAHHIPLMDLFRDQQSFPRSPFQSQSNTSHHPAPNTQYSYYQQAQAGPTIQEYQNFAGSNYQGHSQHQQNHHPQAHHHQSNTPGHSQLQYPNEQLYYQTQLPYRESQPQFHNVQSSHSTQQRFSQPQYNLSQNNDAVLRMNSRDGNANAHLRTNPHASYQPPNGLSNSNSNMFAPHDMASDMARNRNERYNR